MAPRYVNLRFPDPLEPDRVVVAWLVALFMLVRGAWHGTR